MANPPRTAGTMIVTVTATIVANTVPSSVDLISGSYVHAAGRGSPDPGSEDLISSGLNSHVLRTQTVRFHRIVSLVALAALASGCGKKPDKDDKRAEPGTEKGTGSADTKAAVDTTPAPLDVNPDEAVWKQFPIGDTGVSVEAIDGFDTNTGEMDAAHYFRQGYGPAALAVWFGPTRTVQSWRDGFTGRKDVKLSEATKVQVCGVEGEKQEAVLAGRRGGGKTRQSIPLGDGNTVGDEATDAVRSKQPPASGGGGGTLGPGRGIPEAVVVVLGFKHKDGPVVVSYRVPTGHREKLAAIEKHYFESISCD